MIPLDPRLGNALSGSVLSFPSGGAERIEGELLRALVAAGKVEARVLQVVNQTALLEFLNLGSARVRTEVPLRAGDVFAAVVEPRSEGSSEPLRLRVAEIRHEPAAPLRTERLAAQLQAMNVPTDTRHLAMARALLQHAGTVNRDAMAQLNEALNRLAARNPEAANASVASGPQAQVPASGAASQGAGALPVPVKVLDAAAFLVSRGLPVTEESVGWLANRLGADSTSGERLAAIAHRFPEPNLPAAQALSALALSDGDSSETASQLFKLVQAFTPPEARLARLPEAEPGLSQVSRQTPASEPEKSQAAATTSSEAKLPVEPRSGQAPLAEASRPLAQTPQRLFAEPLSKLQEALTSVLERSVRTGEGGEVAREALAEVRFGQLVNVANSDPLQATDRSVAVPLWWSGGSGEIRVQVRRRDGKRRAAGEAEETRVVVTLDTAHLQRVRIDLLLGRKQLNCQVAVEDASIAEVLRQYLPELQEALEATGLRVNALGVKHVSSRASVVMATDALRQVDVWL